MFEFLRRKGSEKLKHEEDETLKKTKIALSLLLFVIKSGACNDILSESVPLNDKYYIPLQPEFIARIRFFNEDNKKHPCDALSPTVPADGVGRGGS